jgi:hypothetical protein
MATTFTGNPATPTPGAGVVITIPADGDAADVASVNSPGPFEGVANLLALLATGPFIGQTISSGTALPTYSPPVLIDINSGSKQSVSYQLLYSYQLTAGTQKRHIRAFMRGDGVLAFTMNANVTNNGTSGWWFADDPNFASTVLWIGGDIGAQSTNDAGGVAMAVVANASSKAYSGLNNSWSETNSGYGGTGWGSYTQLGTSSLSVAGDNFSFGNGANGLNFAIGGTGPNAIGLWQFSSVLTCTDNTNPTKLPVLSVHDVAVSKGILGGQRYTPSGSFGAVPPTVTVGGSLASGSATLDVNGTETCGQVTLSFSSTAFGPSLQLFAVANASGRQPECVMVVPLNGAAAGLLFGTSSSAVQGVVYGTPVSGGWACDLVYATGISNSATSALFGFTAIY